MSVFVRLWLWRSCVGICAGVAPELCQPMSAPRSTDPFSLTEAAIMAGMFQHAPLAALVPEDNRITFGGDSVSIYKENPQESDFPEVCLIPAGFTIAPGGTGTSSSSVSIVQRYTVACHTDEQRTCVLARGMNAVKYELFRAVEKLMHPNIGGGYLGLPFVVGVKFREGSDQLGADFMPVPQGSGLLQRAINGWGSAIQLELLMVIARDEVLA